MEHVLIFCSLCCTKSEYLLNNINRYKKCNKSYASIHTLRVWVDMGLTGQDAQLWIGATDPQLGWLGQLNQTT